MSNLVYSVCDILSRKRDGGKHPPEEILQLINGYIRGDVADYQMSAWLMAVCINGLDNEETAALTAAMVASGVTIDLSGIPGAVVDKHSTGGVGDKTTLVLVPLLASAGLKVAKMSGRGLGITGGTLDKLESIPGFSTKLSKDQFLSQALEVGCVVAGQTDDLVPADRKMYALRDVTATVESIPLITSSVMSKKIAAGAGTILLDVKAGSGAFMKDIESARELARTMIGIGAGMGRRTAAAITGMDQPLGRAVGNVLEVAEAIETLRGGGPDDLRELCLDLGSLLFALSGECETPAEARKRLDDLLADGAALEKFKEMIAAQGGDVRVVDDPSIFPQAAFSRSVYTTAKGYIQSIDAGLIGKASLLLGAGRQKKEDEINPAAGVMLGKKVGDPVEVGDEMAQLYYNKGIDIEAICELVHSAFVIGPGIPAAVPIVREVIGF